MSISFGPKLGLLFNALINESYTDAFRPFLQALDQLIMGSVISSTTVVPPSSPSPGDAYLLSVGMPSGAWAGQLGNIAVWDTQVTLSGTNTLNPSWVFYTPNPGWILWVASNSGLFVYTGSVWQNFASSGPLPVASGGTGAITAAAARANLGAAASGVNADITALTAIAPTVSQPGIVIATSGGGSDNAITISDGTHNSSWTTGGALTTQSVVLASTLTCGGILSSATINSNGLAAATPGDPVTLSATSGSSIEVLIPGQSGNNNLLGFGSAYSTQTTVGSAGSASALPATPAGYLPVNIGGTIFVIPYYAHV